MKLKFSFSALVAVFAIAILFSGCSQSNKHLTFMGIPIDGTLSQFTPKMKEAGFSFLDSPHSYMFWSGNRMKGDFKGWSDVEFMIDVNDKTQMVCGVWGYLVNLPHWDGAEKTYVEMKQKLTDEYGKPSFKNEEFIPPYQKGDGKELEAFINEKATYFTTWESEEGKISLSIRGKEDGYHLSVSFTDRKNDPHMPSSLIYRFFR